MRLILPFAVFILAWISFYVNAQAQSLGKDEEIKKLSALNAQFIKNFLNQDTTSHSKIIHTDFVCIESSGRVVGRKEYLKEWAQGYKNSGYTSFSYIDEFIRVFGNMALVRSKTVYKKIKDGVTSEGSSIYTDTYIKENGAWKCVQAQLTPVKK